MGCQNWWQARKAQTFRKRIRGTKTAVTMWEDAYLLTTLTRACTDNWEEHHQHELRLGASPRNLTSQACLATPGEAHWLAGTTASPGKAHEHGDNRSECSLWLRVGRSFPALPGQSCPKTAPTMPVATEQEAAEGSTAMHYTSWYSTANKNETLTLLTSWLHGS